MQTNFTEEQLQNPRLAEAESILRTCVHCGFCTATCSTYVLLGDERDSPRGRIYLMKDMFEGSKAASDEVAHHVDRCLSCLSCMTTCPSAVDYMHLVDLARAHIQETNSRSLKERLIRSLLVAVLPDPKRFRLALIGAGLARPFRGLFRAIGLKEIAAMLDLAPRSGPRLGRLSGSGTVRVRGRRKKRVALLTGCAQQSLRPEINDATVRLLNRLGVEVVIPEGQGCCGALVHHMGYEAESHKAARQNVDVFTAALRHEPLDAIIINASGCGTTVKDYGHMLSRDQGYAERAQMVSELTMDVTEFLHEIGLDVPEHWSGLKVAYHSACSMQHGQRILEPPRALLRQAGYSVVEVPEGHICCGSAGTYNILQSEIANELRERKINNIKSVQPDVIAAGNIGCITQLQDASHLPVVHTVELLDWALGGPCPKELEPFKGRVRKVRDLIEETAA
ncbi:MAG: glycolate oxidase subunit GlcF [Methyloligellaceae bacterium]